VKRCAILLQQRVGFVLKRMLRKERQRNIQRAIEQRKRLVSKQQIPKSTARIPKKRRAIQCVKEVDHVDLQDSYDEGEEDGANRAGLETKKRIADDHVDERSAGTKRLKNSAYV
jgi:hypothetical protein